MPVSVSYKHLLLIWTRAHTSGNVEVKSDLQTVGSLYYSFTDLSLAEVEKFVYC